MARIARGIVLLGLALSLAGCFRQAEETFEPVTLAPSGSEAVATLPPLVIGTLTATNTLTLLVTVEATNTPDALTETTPQDFVPASDTPSQTFITPGSPLATQIVVTPTPTAGTPASATPGGLITPTDFFNPDEAGSDSACDYTVKSGDTLFRIAVNNETTVDAIKDTNHLTSDTLFPGDKLIIPNCGAETVEATAVPGALPTALPDGWQIHIVASGEVLGTIAEHYGVRQSAIIEANNLDNPNSLSVGQELLIPAPE